MLTFQSLSIVSDNKVRDGNNIDFISVSLFEHINLGRARGAKVLGSATVSVKL